MDDNDKDEQNDNDEQNDEKIFQKPIKNNVTIKQNDISNSIIKTKLKSFTVFLYLSFSF
jgi:hypothetical protein